MSLFTIGYDGSTTLGARTGIGRAALELLRAMIGAEDEHFHFRVLLNSLRHSPGSEHGFLKRDGVQLVRTRRPGPLLVGAWAKGKGPLAEDLLGEGLDVWHGPASYMPQAREARRVVSVYDVAFLDESEGSREKLGSAMFAGMFPRLLPTMDQIVTSSEATRARLVETYGLDEKCITVIPLGVDHDVFQPAGERFVQMAGDYAGMPDKTWLLAVTGRAERKRNGLLLDTYEVMRKGDERIPKLLVVGWDGSPPRELRERPHLHRHVIVADRIPDEHMPGLYSGSVATILTSRCEGFGLPVLEAMACGSPVICAGTSSLPEVGGDAARYVNSESPHAWADAVMEVSFDQGAHDELRARGLVQAKRFTWEKAGGLLLDVYADVGSR